MSNSTIDRRGLLAAGTLIGAVGAAAASFSAALLLGAVATQADAQSAPLSAKEIRHLLIGKVISDGAHWHYYLKPDGTIDGEELSRPRKGRWRFKENRLCITIVNGAAPDECWEVTREGKKLMLGTNGQVVYSIRVEPGPLRHDR